MVRKNILCNGFNLSYLDNEKEGDVMICLHGHYGSGSMFTFLEKIFDGRLILVDQRGHGFSDHANSYTREDYISDLHTIITELRIKNPILLGHSLGGTNVFQYAAKYQNVSKIIIEDIDPEFNALFNPFENFPEEFDSIYDVSKELLKIDMELDSYFMENLYYDGLKWKFRFNYNEIFNSLKEMAGSFWNDWNKVNCPILLMHGKDSWASNTEKIYEMAKRNGNTELKIFENVGHTIRDEAREEYCNEIRKFIENIRND